LDPVRDALVKPGQPVAQTKDTGTAYVPDVQVATAPDGPNVERASAQREALTSYDEGMTGFLKSADSATRDAAVQATLDVVNLLKQPANADGSGLDAADWTVLRDKFSKIADARQSDPGYSSVFRKAAELADQSVKKLEEGGFGATDKAVAERRELLAKIGQPETKDVPPEERPGKVTVNGIEVSAGPAVTKDQFEKALQSGPLKRWLDTKNPELIIGKDGFRIDHVYMFGPKKVGFVVGQADSYQSVGKNADGADILKPVPGIMFLRGDADAAMTIIRDRSDKSDPRYPNGKEYALVIDQLRAPVGRSIIEAVAGMAEGEDKIGGNIIKELREEVGLDVSRVKRMAKIYTSPGGTDEGINLSLGVLETSEDPKIAAAQLAKIRGRIGDGAGAEDGHEENEARIRAGLVPYDQILDYFDKRFAETGMPADGKLLAMLPYVQRIRRDPEAMAEATNDLVLLPTRAEKEAAAKAGAPLAEPIQTAPREAVQPVAVTTGTTDRQAFDVPPVVKLEPGSDKVTVNGVVVTKGDKVDRADFETALNSAPLRNWLDNLDPKKNVTDFRVDQIDKFGPKGVGFVFGEQLTSDGEHTAKMLRGNSTAAMTVIIDTSDTSDPRYPQGKEYALVVDQLRAAVGSTVTESPAGMVFGGTMEGSIEEAVRKEVGIEPTGLSYARDFVLGDDTDEVFHGFIARKLATADQMRQIEERIDAAKSRGATMIPRLVPMDQLVDGSGTVADAKTVVMLGVYEGTNKKTLDKATSNLELVGAPIEATATTAAQVRERDAATNDLPPEGQPPVREGETLPPEEKIDPDMVESVKTAARKIIPDVLGTAFTDKPVAEQDRLLDRLARRILEEGARTGSFGRGAKTVTGLISAAALAELISSLAHSGVATPAEAADRSDVLVRLGQ
jgi:hypothetical protein